jgi:hypothetical protein
MAMLSGVSRLSTFKRGYATARMNRLENNVIDYEKYAVNLETWRKKTDYGSKPLTLAEKILYGHLENPSQKVQRLRLIN